MALGRGLKFSAESSAAGSAPISISTIFLRVLVQVEILKEEQVMSDFPKGLSARSGRDIHLYTSGTRYKAMSEHLFAVVVIIALTPTTAFPLSCCVQWPKQSSGLAVSPDRCLELIFKSCSELWSPYGFKTFEIWGKRHTCELAKNPKRQKVVFCPIATF